MAVSLQSNLKNPIPEQITDIGQLDKSFLSDFPIIPYFGTSETPSHQWLSILKNIASLSPVHNICKGNISSYAFGGITADAQFIESLQTNFGIDSRRLVTISNELYNEFSDIGNMYLRVRLAEVNGVWRASFASVDARHVAYLIQDPMKQPILVYTEKFSKEYWKKKLPVLIEATPFDGEFGITKVSKGVYETVIHVKSKNGTYYGSPKTVHFLEDLSIDYMVRQMMNKASSTEMIAKYLLLIQGQPPETLPEDYDPTMASKQLAKTLRELTTAEGDVPKSLGYLQFPYGVEKPDVIKMDVNRDYQFNEMSLNRAAKTIYAMHDWSPILSGEDSAPGSIGSNLLSDLFILKNVSCVMPLQDLMLQVWGKAFEWISLVSEIELTADFTFRDTVGEAVRLINESQNGTSNVITNG